MPDYPDDEPAPFSRPVIYFAIGLAVTVLVVGYRLKLYWAFLNSSQFGRFSNPAEYIPILEPLIYMELIANSAILLAALALLFHLPEKAWSFIKWVRVYLIAALIYQVLEIAAYLSLHASLAEKHLAKPLELLSDEWHLGVLYSVGLILMTLFWLGYFSTTKRVKKIFIN